MITINAPETDRKTLYAILDDAARMYADKLHADDSVDFFGEPMANHWRTRLEQTIGAMVQLSAPEAQADVALFLAKLFDAPEAR